MHLIAALHGLSVADDRGMVRIPAHRVAAAKHRERAEAVEASRGTAKPRISRVDAPIDRRPKPAIGADQAGSDHAEAAPDVERLEREPKRLIRALAAAESSSQGAQQL